MKIDRGRGGRGRIILIVKLNLKLQCQSQVYSNYIDYSGEYILAKRTITLAAAILADINNKQVMLKHYVPFADSTTEINNKQVDNPKNIDVVMQMYNLIEFGDNYLGATKSLWQYYKNEPKNQMTDSS